MRILLVTLVATALIAACSTSPTGRKQLTLIPDSQMNQMGEKAFASMKASDKISQDPALARYVQCIADPIIRAAGGGEWEVVVFENSEPNAFALPGRKIGIHTGILAVATTQHQLAAIMGHEVSHVLAEHGNERVSQQFAVSQGVALIEAATQPESETGKSLFGLLGVGAQVGILLPFSRAHETEADRHGLDLMAKAGFDPRESVTLWQNMAKLGGSGGPGFLSTHPSHDDRMTDLSQRIPQVMPLYEAAVREGRAPNCQQR
jgi:predicted Zn-dependent protease